MSKAKLVLLDAHALIHRAYHAIPTDLLSPTGEPTKAVYGFTSTLLKVLKDIQPRYVAAAFDVGKSFRVEQFADYKANRPRLADDLRAQIARVRDVCAAFGIPIYAKEGYEADDLLGSLDRQAGEQGIETIIVTGDTDTFQLVDADTEVLTFTRQFGDMILYDHDKIVERYGLEPVQLVDLKALRGDASDNIPGVPGVGDKTATRLLQTYGTVEGILSHLDEVDDKTAGRLEPNKEQITRSKGLVTIDRSAPAVLDLEAARFDEFERDRVLALFRELGFQSLLSRLPETAGASQPVEAATSAELDQTGGEDYRTVSTEVELTDLARELKRSGKFVVDVETTDLDELKADLVGIAIGVGDRKGYYVPVGHMAARHPAAAPAKKGGKKPQPALFDESSETIAVQQEPMGEPPPQVPLERVRAALAPLFGDRDIQKVAHNSKYDMIVLGEHGIETRGMGFDTLIAAHLLEPSGQRLGLKELAFAKFGVQMTEIEGLIGKGKNQIQMSEVTVEKAAQYACADADYTFRLMELYAPQLTSTGLDKLFYELEMPLVPVIIELERAGVLLDSAALGKFGEELDERLRGLEKQIYELCGAEFNLGSPVQLSDTLFGKLGLPSTHLDRTRSGQISTAAGVLEELRDKHPVIALILEHRELAKLKGTYVDALPELVNPRDGRLHTSFNQTGTVTGRISSSNPNLQNIPIKTELGRRVRRSFIAPPGSVILSADYSQVELRILAHVSKDENLLQAFADGEDIHASTAARLFNVPIGQVTSAQRRLGKTINFGVAYGISDRGVAGRTELNLEESRELINNYFAKFPRVREYMDRTKELARSQGYVESLMGRRRYFPELAAGRRVPINVRNQAEREAINMPIQASAADIIKRAMVDLYRALHERGYKSRMILQVHDELVLECPRDEVPAVAPLVCDLMENAYTLDAPLKVDVVMGPNWDDMKPVEA